MPLLISSLAWWVVLSLTYAVAAVWKTRRPQILLAGASLLLACLAAEFALRLVAPEASLPDFRGASSVRFHHALPPDSRMFAGYTDGEPVVVQTNVDGLRTHYSRAGFLGHGHRILILGDSFVFGLNVTQEKIMAVRLEKILRERLGTNDLAVVSAGVSSYSPFLESLRCDDLLSDYKPTLTLLYFDRTDVSDDQEYMVEYAADLPEKRAGRFHHRGAPVGPWLGALNERILKPFLWRHLLPPFDAMITTPLEQHPRDPNHVMLDDGTTADRWFIYKRPLSETRPYFDKSFENIREIARNAKAAGSGFVLFIIPRSHHWSDRECPQNAELAAYGNDEPHEFAIFDYFAEVAPSAGFDVHSLLPEFRATTRFPLVFDTDPHWNADGNEFAAGITADYLLERKYLP